MPRKVDCWLGNDKLNSSRGSSGLQSKTIETEDLDTGTTPQTKKAKMKHQDSGIGKGTKYIVKKEKLTNMNESLSTIQVDPNSESREKSRKQAIAETLGDDKSSDNNNEVTIFENLLDLLNDSIEGDRAEKAILNDFSLQNSEVQPLLNEIMEKRKNQKNSSNNIEDALDQFEMLVLQLKEEYHKFKIGKKKKEKPIEFSDDEFESEEEEEEFDRESE